MCYIIQLKAVDMEGLNVELSEVHLHVVSLIL